MRAARRPGIALSLLFVLGACSNGGEPAASTPTPTSEVTATTGSGPTTEIDEALDAIVIAEAAAPNGTRFLQRFDGDFSGTQVIQDSPAEVRSMALEGWIGALTREFASPEAAEVIRGNAPADELDPADHRFVGSIASVYEDAASVRAALAVMLDEVSARLHDRGDLELGDGGAIFRDRFLHVPSITYLWADGQYLLVLSANGMDEDEVFAIAQGMEERVPAS